MITSTQSVLFIVWLSDISIWPDFEHESKDKFLKSQVREILLHFEPQAAPK